MNRSSGLLSDGVGAILVTSKDVSTAARSDDVVWFRVTKARQSGQIGALVGWAAASGETGVVFVKFVMLVCACLSETIREVAKCLTTYNCTILLAESLEQSRQLADEGRSV